MLGSIDPRSLRLTCLGAVYPGRDHVTTIRVEQFDGRRYRAVSFAGVTRMVMVLVGTVPQVTVDSALLPDALWWSADSVIVDLSTMSMPDSIHPVYLVAFDAAHPRGRVVIDNIDARVLVEVRNIRTGDSDEPVEPDEPDVPEWALVNEAGQLLVGPGGVVLTFGSDTEPSTDPLLVDANGVPLTDMWGVNLVYSAPPPADTNYLTNVAGVYLVDPTDTILTTGATT